ncbi:hypothetical protein BLA29_009722 [Euroglyphus maynei]|uniref:Uncharacterized protein n=1 Tax=Euroglyphus maynei TaxID=6958 RepID=A0A1Y3B8S7_EURMA|nr:hypothetical protein BLA29_009722 [Euroglyphus maynei]
MDHIGIFPLNNNDDCDQQSKQIELQRKHLSLCVICKQPLKILHNDDEQQLIVISNIIENNNNCDKKIVCE